PDQVGQGGQERGAYLDAARGFADALRPVIEAIKTTPGGEHVRLSLDEWGFTFPEQGWQPALFTAMVLNVLGRLAPYVEIGGKVTLVNPSATMQRIGQTVTTHEQYRVMQLFNQHHRSSSVVADSDSDEIDVSAYSDDDGVSAIIANTSTEPRTVTVDLGV